VSRVAESTLVEASLAEVWDYYFEPRGWPAWVDGFGSTQASDGYPEAGGSLRWRSNHSASRSISRSSTSRESVDAAADVSASGSESDHRCEIESSRQGRLRPTPPGASSTKPYFASWKAAATRLLPL